MGPLARARFVATKRKASPTLGAPVSASDLSPSDGRCRTVDRVGISREDAGLPESAPAPRREPSSVRLLIAYAALLKPRIVVMVLVTCAIGLLLASGGHPGPGLALATLLGTALLAGGACALNQVLERTADSLMERTRRRPVPGGIIQPAHALAFGVLLVLAGCALLAVRANLLTAFLGLLSAFLYVLVYTPAKRLSWICTPIGAVSGAIPPLMGWAAVAGLVGAGAWVLFALLFLWQHVHFCAIAWLNREDYRRAGFRVLPVVEPAGTWTFRQIVLAAAALAPVAALLVGTGLVGPAWQWGTPLAGLAMFVAAVGLFRSRSRRAARFTALASAAYLPLLLWLVVLDLHP